MRSSLPFRAALVPSIRKAYLPSRTGSVTTLMPSNLGVLFHCSVLPVSKSPRQRISAETVVADRNGIITSKGMSSRVFGAVMFPLCRSTSWAGDRGQLVAQCQCSQYLCGADVGNVVVVASIERVHPPAAAHALALLQQGDAALDALVAGGHAALAQQD